eukprot:XP_011663734.1 PREDICTED: flocculation protein FLO11-like [Strongylocentrotus purpuratus]
MCTEVEDSSVFPLTDTSPSSQVYEEVGNNLREDTDADDYTFPYVIGKDSEGYVIMVSNVKDEDAYGYTLPNVTFHNVIRTTSIDNKDENLVPNYDSASRTTEKVEIQATSSIKIDKMIKDGVHDSIHSKMLTIALAVSISVVVLIPVLIITAVAVASIWRRALRSKRGRANLDTIKDCSDSTEESSTQAATTFFSTKTQPSSTNTGTMIFTAEPKPSPTQKTTSVFPFQPNSSPTQKTTSIFSSQPSPSSKQKTTSVFPTRPKSSPTQNTISIFSSQPSPSSKQKTTSVFPTRPKSSPTQNTISVFPAEPSPSSKQKTTSVFPTRPKSSPTKNTISVFSSQPSPSSKQKTTSVFPTQPSPSSIQNTISVFSSQPSPSSKQKTTSVFPTQPSPSSIQKTTPEFSTQPDPSPDTSSEDHTSLLPNTTPPPFWQPSTPTTVGSQREDSTSEPSTATPAMVYTTKNLSTHAIHLNHEYESTIAQTSLCTEVEDNALAYPSSVLPLTYISPTSQDYEEVGTNLKEDMDPDDYTFPNVRYRSIGKDTEGYVIMVSNVKDEDAYGYTLPNVTFHNVIRTTSIDNKDEKSGE